MSILIDNLIYSNNENKAMQCVELNGVNIWVIAKPYTYFTVQEFLRRIKDCFRILTFKSFAVHYFSDEKR